MNKKQESLIIGSLLGDGYLTKHDKGGLPVLSIQHSEKQKEYLEWLHKRFLELNMKASKIYDVSQKYPAYRFNVSFEEKEGINLRHKMYPNNNKTITRHLLNKLDEEGLAIWFMDDGNREIHWKKDNTLSHYGLGISTHSFTYEEQKIIQKYFLVRWKIEVSIVKDRQYFRLRFNQINSDKLIKIIEPYIIPSMKYKIIIPQTR